MAKRGRPPKSGKRTKAGRLARTTDGLPGGRDYGNVKVVERHSRFRHFIDDKGLVFEGTSVGRLWIVGGFDGYELDPQVMRDTLLDYGGRYWRYYPSSIATTNYTQDNRRGYDGGDENTPDPLGERFNLLDKALRDAGKETRSAVHHVAVDQHFFPDEDKDWVARVVNTRIAEKRKALREAKKPIPATLTICGELACESDLAMLRLVCEGALALHYVKTLKKAA